MPLTDADIARALARNDRYVHEIVEALNVCPYAKTARLDGKTARYVVELDADGALVPTALHLDVLAAMAEDDGPEVVQWIYPTATHDAAAWDRAGKAFTDACHAQLGRSVVGVAPLHPEAAWLDRSPAAMVPLFRRAPDPTLQWIALRSLAEVRRSRPRGEVLLPRDPAEANALLAQLARPSIVDTIATNNHATATTIGLDAFEERMAALRETGADDDAP